MFVWFRYKADTKNTQYSYHASQYEETVRNPSFKSWAIRKELKLTDLCRRSSSSKYFSLHSTSVELVTRQLGDSGLMLSGFINAVSNGIQMDDPKPYPLWWWSCFSFKGENTSSLPRYKAGNHSSYLRWEPLLGSPIGNWVHKDKAQSVTDSHREDN